MSKQKANRKGLQGYTQHRELDRSTLKSCSVWNKSESDCTNTGGKGKRETIISPGKEHCTESKARNSLCFSGRIDTCCKYWQSKYTGLAPSTSILLQPSRKHTQVAPGEGQSCQLSMCATGRQQPPPSSHELQRKDDKSKRHQPSPGTQGTCL